jgi:hypothetical protein
VPMYTLIPQVAGTRYPRQGPSIGTPETAFWNLTRRANHRHRFIVAEFRARVGKPVAGFFNGTASGSCYRTHLYPSWHLPSFDMVVDHVLVMFYKSKRLNSLSGISLGEPHWVRDRPAFADERAEEVTQISG